MSGNPNTEQGLNDSVNEPWTQPGRFGKPAQQSPTGRDGWKVRRAAGEQLESSWGASAEEFTAGWNHTAERRGADTQGFVLGLRTSLTPHLN